MVNAPFKRRTPAFTGKALDYSVALIGGEPKNHVVAKIT
jgi:hypothetical protein